MMDKNQSQQAGDNSQQLQLANCNVNGNVNCTVFFGIDEKRAREIADEIFMTRIKELSFESHEIAQERVQKFINDLIPKMQKIDDALRAFSDPAFQFMLSEAQKTAAKTERPADYELLSELLIRRIEKGTDRYVSTGVGKAVEIVDDIPDDALIGLTTSVFLDYYLPISGTISEGLDLLDEILRRVLYDDLPTGSDWIDNLEVLGAIRVSMITGSPRAYADTFSKDMQGYCAVGINKDSADYSKAVNMLKKVNLHSKLLCEHELNPGFTRLAIANEKFIDDLSYVLSGLTIGTPAIKGVSATIQLNDEQRETLHQIYAMYENNSKLKKVVHKNLLDEIEKRTSLSKSQQWWNNLPYSHQVTSVGRALAYANLKRIYPTIPHLK